MKLAQAGEAQSADKLRRYPRCAAATTRSGPGWFAVATGVRANDMNGVVSEPGAPISDSLVDDLVEWFARLRLPASWIVVGGDDVLARALVERGAQAETTGWWAGRPIGADLLELPCPPGIDIGRVASAQDLDDWLDIADRCGWCDDARDRRARRGVLTAIGVDDDQFVLWLARRDGRPVGMARSYSTGAVLDLCDLAVLEEERRQGVGTALAGARIRAAHDRGATTIVSALSPEGWELYRTLGFTSVPVRPGRWFYLPTLQW